jgi:uncharacterized beta-barrel protein YwiB (DUF1934 family)
VKIPLYIQSTIHAAGESKADVVRQRLDADYQKEDDHILITYQEGDGDEKSAVSLFAYADHMVIARQGPISYQQEYRPNQSTICEIQTSMGFIKMQVQTYFYERNEKEHIACTFALAQEDVNIGEYQLLITWEL